ncbi:hypothetical protein [Streptomyces sp. 8L]|uniref:hypothetical protein n=1 Tax=Streptomyces sp. 8L TaxID=2877242 RepID=UPI001CD34B86|nr:hypothetical protein [Streptomyces sp. 8L]MCA1223470.1 hypothetical protein [Streptomyces sp. 8L]
MTIRRIARKTRYLVTYPAGPDTATNTVRAHSTESAIRAARLAGFTTPAGRTVDLNAEPEVRKVTRRGDVHVYGPRYEGR